LKTTSANTPGLSAKSKPHLNTWSSDKRLERGGGGKDNGKREKRNVLKNGQNGENKVKIVIKVGKKGSVTKKISEEGGGGSQCHGLIVRGQKRRPVYKKCQKDGF